MDTSQALHAIKTFEEHYQYNSDYLREILHASAEAFGVYEGFLPMAGHRKAASADIYFVCKLATTKFEDCGPCLQLVVRMALESGVPKDVVRGAVSGGDGLDERLKEVHDFALDVAGNAPLAIERVEHLKATHGEAALVELALAIASARIFPTLKRALGHGQSCSTISYDAPRVPASQ